MTGQAVVCAIDVGSTFIKATLRANVDNVLARSSVPYPHDAAYGSAHDRVWSAFACAIREVCANQAPDAIILSCQMAGLSMIDDAGEPLGPLIPGVTVRAPRTGMIDVRRSGCGDVRASGVAKLLWLTETARGLSLRSAQIGGIKEFLLYRLCGEWVTDRASASSSGFYDIAGQHWSDDTLELTGVTEHQLPRIAELDAVVGEILPAAAETCGVPVGTRVFCGLGDGPAANISSEAVGPQTMCLSRGTTVVVRVLFSGPAPDLGSLPIFTQHVQGWWKCVGVRLTVASDGLFEPPGDPVPHYPVLRFRADQVGAYLQPILDTFGVSDVRPVGGRAIPLPEHWPIHEVPADAQDGTRGMAMIASGWQLATAAVRQPAKSVSS